MSKNQVKLNRNNYIHEIINIRLPLLLILFCKEFIVSKESFNNQKEILKDKKLEGNFCLNTHYINSLKNLKEILSLDRSCFLQVENQHVINGSLQFIYNEKTKFSAFFIIDINPNDPRKSKLTGFSDNERFRDLIIRNILQLIAV